MTAPSIAEDLTASHFSRIAVLVKHVAGIDLRPGKEGLVRSRLASRLRALGVTSFDDYLAHLDADASGAELVQLLDVITTNKTSFFREPEHFRLLQDEILPALAGRAAGIRVWSAGCSSGEEPYTTAIVLRESLDARRFADARVLATDLSTRVLSRAREGVYAEEMLADVPPQLVRRHFAGASRGDRMLRVVDATRACVRFARLNLMGRWPMQGPFDVIFCRNVMIYFDKATQQRLVQRFTELLASGGYLFVGHSESLTGIDHGLRYVQPAVYRR
ncbi:MAG TPA: protein-glutamate O-methyltransferase CheR [Gemmatimonadaceae bacterium]|nr:protein-glutamate O-methyltransferase CheR [Gemmatimonadaceae bacterium]